MTRNDIDLALLVAEPGFSLVTQLMLRLRERGFNRYWIFDNLEGGWPEDPRYTLCEVVYGFYDQRVPAQDRWSVGIAVCAPEAADRVLALTHRVGQALAADPSLRAVIVGLKFALAEKYGTERLSGNQVYEAVLDHRVRTLEEFDRLRVTSQGI